MKFRLLAFFIMLGTWKCEGQQVCIKGSRTTIGDSIQTSLMTQGTVCEHTNKCLLSTLVYEVDDVPAKLEIADCFSTDASVESCASLTRRKNVGGEPTCTQRTCTTFACNRFSIADGCTVKPPEGDMLFLPNCTLNALIDRMSGCLVRPEGGLPYKNRDVCIKHMESSYSCGRDVIISCTTGHCRSVFDPVSYPMQIVYQLMPEYIATSYWSALAKQKSRRFDGMTEEQIQDINCSVEEDVANITLNGILDVLDANKSRLLSLIPNVMCDSKAVINFLRHALPLRINMYRAKNEASYCRSQIKLLKEVANTWSNHCSKTALLKLIQIKVPATYSPMYAEIEKAVDILEELLLKSHSVLCEGFESTMDKPSSEERLTETSATIRSHRDDL